MLHRILCCDAVCWVTLEHELEQVKTLVIESWHKLGKGLLRVPFSVRVSLDLLWVEWEFLESGPLFHGWSAAYAEDFLQLFLFVLAGEERRAVNNLSEDAADRPHVDRSGVIL